MFSLLMYLTGNDNVTIISVISSECIDYMLINSLVIKFSPLINTGMAGNCLLM